MRNRFHSLCPYFAMFPESFAEEWIDRLTCPGQTVIDPFAGRGTAPFQALLMGRNAIAGDTNPVAYCVSKAKLQTPSATAVARRLTCLERAFENVKETCLVDEMPSFFHHAFHRQTLVTLLHLRRELRWRDSPVDCMIAALVLGSLHGELSSPSYLSNQMPRTISTKPAYSVRWWEQRQLQPPERDTFKVLRNRLTFRYRSDRPARKGRAYHCDVRDLPQRTHSRAHLAITSPPYLNVTSYEEDQWLRLWFLGGPEYPKQSRISPDDRHNSARAYKVFMEDTWSALSKLLYPHAHVVIRIGGLRSTSEELIELAEETSKSSGRSVNLIEHRVSMISNRQTASFRPGSTGCLFEVDLHFSLDSK